MNTPTLDPGPAPASEETVTLDRQTFNRLLLLIDRAETTLNLQRIYYRTRQKEDLIAAKNAESLLWSVICLLQHETLTRESEGAAEK